MFNDKYYIIYNIPGLIEGDEKCTALNKQEITRAFEEQQGNPLIIVYVFGHENGRIRNEDLITFRTIDNAYRFCSDSLIILINRLPTHRPKTYDKETRATIIDFLGMKPSQICFIDQLDSMNSSRSKTRQELIDAIRNVYPRIDSKVNHINLDTEDICTVEIDLNNIRQKIKNDRAEHEKTIENLERNYEIDRCLGVNNHNLIL